MPASRRLLHDCDENVNCHDYDFRSALHLATASAKLLAVSFLLGVSANPNQEDRWGRRPLDEAFSGWTQYHKYCAKLIHGWGGRLGQLNGTEEGQQKMRELDAIDMDAIRAILTRLITDGHRQTQHAKLGKQEVRQPAACVPLPCTDWSALAARTDGVECGRF